MEWILDADISAFDSYEDVRGKTVAEERPTGEGRGSDPYFDHKVNPLKCPLCDFVGSDYQRTRTHFKKHDTDVTVKTVITNQCLVCENTFADNQCARQNCRSMEKNNTCPARNRPGSNKFGPAAINKINEVVCGICNE